MSFGDQNRIRELGWIEKIQGGDDQAFEELFKKYYLPLTRFAWRYVGSKAIAEELVQEIFSEIWEDRKTIDINESVRSWLYKAVKHLSLNYIKHQRVKMEYDSRWMKKKNNVPTIDFEDRQRIEYIKKEIGKAIGELPPRSKMTYKLHR